MAVCTDKHQVAFIVKVGFSLFRAKKYMMPLRPLSEVTMLAVVTALFSQLGDGDQNGISSSITFAGLPHMTFAS